MRVSHSALIIVFSIRVDEVGEELIDILWLAECVHWVCAADDITDILHDLFAVVGCVP